MSEIPVAAISATKTFVSAKMTRRPGLAKTMFADTIPRKNFPISVPPLFQTCQQRVNFDICKKRKQGPNLNTISTARIYIPVCIDLDAVGNASVCVRKDAAVHEHLCMRIDVECVAIWKLRTDPKPSKKWKDTHIVAGRVWSFPSRDSPTDPVSVLGRWFITRDRLNKSHEISRTYKPSDRRL